MRKKLDSGAKAYVDPKETSESVRGHLEEYDYPCPGLRDPEHRLARETGATVTPEAIVFDAERKITYRGRIDNLYADFGKARDETSSGTNPARISNKPPHS